MRTELAVLALVVGAGTWALRYIPLRLRADRRPRSRHQGAGSGLGQAGESKAGPVVVLIGRFLGATGVAAVAALAAASLLPYVQALAGSGGGETPEASAPLGKAVPLVVGILATVAAFLPRGSVGAGTVIGAAAYGLCLWLLGGA